MSYASAFAIFILILTPLLLPMTISGVHAFAKLRRNLRIADGQRSKEPLRHFIDGRLHDDLVSPTRLNSWPSATATPTGS